MRGQTDGQTYACDHNTFRVVYVITSWCDQVSILRPHVSRHVLRVDQSTSVDVLPDSRSVHYDLPADGTVFVGGLPPSDAGAGGGLRGAQTPPPSLGRPSRLLQRQLAVAPPPPYLPKQIRSRGFGFQGCLGSIDLNGDRWRLSQRLDDVPTEHRDDIVEGCHGMFDVCYLRTISACGGLA